ncbi:MAG: hypothetical protein QOD12_1766 [Verrucomicrobiota bacterium]|jgi:hypothetical protein
MKKISARTLFLLLIFFGTVGPLWAQIAYVSVGQNGTLQLHQMNADGSGDTLIGLPFSNPGFPTWSRDGALLAVTAFDGTLQGLHTQNVYSISRATGALQKLTNYLDILDPQNVALSYTFPYYKAFSPDRSALATFSLTQTGGGGNGVVDLPVLEIHSLTAAANPIQVHTDKGRNGRHHGGEGVDWSPTQNVLAAPLESSAPFLSGGGPGETTAIFLIDPVNAAVLQGRARQVTAPRADADISTGLFWTEHDYQPKFSPNGVGLAYVRSFQSHALLTSLTPNPDIQSLHILNVNTGADTQVITFPAGRYVSSLDWSPDGTQLVFDLALQASNSVVGLLQQGQPETNQIYVVNVNGTGLTQLRGNGNGTPSWSRTSASQQPITLGNISTRMRVGSGDNAMIGGFIITGSQSKKVIIRGMGPSLGAAGVQGALTDPLLELHDGSGAIIATNDNWQQAPNTTEIPNGFAPGDPRESVIVTTLAPGTYTAVVRGAHGETGVGIVETYDLTLSASSKLANISTRGFVETGDNAMIGGLIMTGGSAKVIVRAIGPSLQNAGIANALQDPTLDLINGNGASVASNDNWQQAPNTNEIPSGFSPSDPRESVIVTTLSAGNYTAIVRGKNNTVGIAVVEAYNLQ